MEGWAIAAASSSIGRRPIGIVNAGNLNGKPLWPLFFAVAQHKLSIAHDNLRYVPHRMNVSWTV
jgi:hypothetical protein